MHATRGGCGVSGFGLPPTIACRFAMRTPSPIAALLAVLCATLLAHPAPVLAVVGDGLDYEEYKARPEDMPSKGVLAMGPQPPMPPMTPAGSANINRFVRFSGSNCKGKPAPFLKVCWSERGIRRECDQYSKYGTLRCRLPKVRLFQTKIKRKVLVGLCRIPGGTLTHLCARPSSPLHPNLRTPCRTCGRSRVRCCVVVVVGLYRPSYMCVLVAVSRGKS